MEALIHHFKLVTEGFKVPVGEVYVPIESPRGELGYHVVSTGGTKPWRVHVRDPSFINLQSVPHMVRGGLDRRRDRGGRERGSGHGRGGPMTNGNGGAPSALRELPRLGAEADRALPRRSLSERVAAAAVSRARGAGLRHQGGDRGDRRSARADARGSRSGLNLLHDVQAAPARPLAGQHLHAAVVHARRRERGRSGRSSRSAGSAAAARPPTAWCRSRRSNVCAPATGRRSFRSTTRTTRAWAPTSWSRSSAAARRRDAAAGGARGRPARLRRT